jgi:hypothetical protein
MTRRRVHVRRYYVRTDYDAAEPEYLGLRSGAFMLDDNQQIVDVDWSVPGEVCVTYLEPDRDLGALEPTNPEGH